MVKLHISDINKIFNINLDLDCFIDTVSTDTRTISKNSVFVAIKGPRFDGNDYIEEAFYKGAIIAFSEFDIKSNNGIVIKVDNVINAYQKLANCYIKKLDLKKICVTGSVGKTSTKEMIYSVLSGFEKTLKTKENLNNEIGVSQTVFCLDNTYKNAVIEFGMSDFFEIDSMSKCIEPNISVITNIGYSHIETLKDKLGVFKAKIEIINGMNQDGFLILNIDDEILKEKINNINFKNILTYSIDDKNSDVYASDIIFGEKNTKFCINYKNNKYNTNINTLGEHNVRNALAGFLVGVTLGYNEDLCAKNLINFSNCKMRENYVQKNNIIFIEDCYNASPDSMKAAFRTLSLVDSKRKICVLGDMLELGDDSVDLHKDLSKYIFKNNIDFVFTLGDYAKNITYEMKEDRYKNFFNKKDLEEFLKTFIKEEDAILFKASRSLKLEEVIGNIYSYLEQN